MMDSRHLECICVDNWWASNVNETSAVLVDTDFVCFFFFPYLLSRLKDILDVKIILSS